MPTKRQAAKVATRAKVVEAARILFNAGGYEAATMRSIAAVAGVSTGAVFANFSGKEALYREVFGHPPVSPEIGAGLLNVVRRALAANAPLDQQMARGLIAKLSEA